MTVIPAGVAPACSPSPDPEADRRADQLLGPARPDAVEFLHVGSTIDRKRIDTLLEVVARVRARIPGVRLIRAGGELTGAQQALAGRLGVEDAVAAVPFIDRTVLASLYRRAALVLLPSEREGFGLPIVEAMACGTPVVASDIPALREVGGTAVSYCPVGAVARWVACLSELLEERRTDPDRWERRRQAALARASGFSWRAYAAGMAGLYREVLTHAGAPEPGRSGAP